MIEKELKKGELLREDRQKLKEIVSKGKHRAAEADPSIANAD